MFIISVSVGQEAMTDLVRFYGSGSLMMLQSGCQPGLDWVGRSTSKIMNMLLTEGFCLLPCWNKVLHAEEKLASSRGHTNEHKSASDGCHSFYNLILEVAYCFLCHNGNTDQPWHNGGGVFIRVL